MYLSADALSPGDIVSAAGTENVTRAFSGDGRAILGVVSSNPGLVLGIDPSGAVSGQYPIALSGRVPVHVNLDNGSIQTGDRVALSTSTPGIGMKARLGDTSVGVALESYTATSIGNSIMVFMNLNSGTDVQMLAQKLASSTATSTASSILSSFATASLALGNALSQALSAITNITQSGVRELGIAVHASLGVFDKIFAKEVHTDNLCVGNVCVTQDQFLKMIQSSGTAAAVTAPPPPITPPAPSPVDTALPVVPPVETTVPVDTTPITPPADITTPPATPPVNTIIPSADTSTTAQTPATDIAPADGGA
jgi:hypothetical protein